MCQEGMACYRSQNDDFLNEEDSLITLLQYYRRPETVDMDEIMAAMVLTSLSCSPVIQHAAPGSVAPGMLNLTHS